VPINGHSIINSDQILDMKEVPRTLIVVGGGVIGVEYACMFAVLGVRIVLVERRPRLLEFADAEIVEALSYHLREKRVTLRLNEEVAGVEESNGGVVANLKSNKRISGDVLLYAVGRQGTSTDSTWRLPGCRRTIAGRVKVDENFAPVCPTSSRSAT
jgi:NAD(P) transhydrogenase